jgi:uncharacterized phiE125 gp8 family phage protein
MNLRAITDVGTPVGLDLADVKSSLRITHVDADDILAGYIQAAISEVENPAGLYGLGLAPRTWELALDEFPAAEIHLPVGPVASVTSVKYTDSDGFEQTVSSADYEVDTYPEREGWIVPVTDFTWPTSMDTINAVRVRWVAGIGCPAPVAVAIKLMVQRTYDQPSGPAGDALDRAIEALLSPWVRYFV